MRRATAVGVLVALLNLAAVAAGARAATGMPPRATPAATATGVSATTPSAIPATIRAAIQRATGHSPAQLSTRAACGSAVPGEVRCYARVLTLAGSGRTVTPLQSPRPAATSAPAAFTPAFLQSAYDTAWLSANRGAGDTVAIVDAYGDSSAYSDMEQFRSANGLPSLPVCGGSVSSSCFERVNQNGQTSPLPAPGNGWAVEESLDIDAVSSLCPLCKILMVEANSDDSSGSPDLETAVAQAAALGANQISLSWGADVAPDAAGWESPYSSITHAAVLAAAGDGAYPGPNVGYPAALASVTAVGGTALSADPGVARGYDESTWSTETCAGGSICATESGCDTSQAVPSFQSSAVTGCVGRAYNDVSADASPSTGLEIYDSQPGSGGCGTANNWCIIGGTSLATPLTAALEAVTGVSGTTTPAWTYSDAGLLNDILSGSDGSCPLGWHLICNAAAGWDGPTGNGSISGDLVAGGPGIGAQPDATGIGAASASVSGYVNPNDSSLAADTTAYWQYGPTVAYGSSTSAVALSPGTSFQSTTATLALSQPCTYHYRLVAANALGTVYGYDHTVTPTQVTTMPANTELPSIAGTPATGEQLVAAPGSWSGVACETTYQWREASSPSATTWTPIGGASSASYTPVASDSGQYLQVAVTQSNSAGSTTASSAAVGPVTQPSTGTTGTTTTGTSTTGTPTTATPTTGTTTTGGATTLPPTTGGSPSNQPQSTPPTGQAPTTTTVRFYRCASRCVLIRTGSSATYTPRRADYGRYIKVVRTVRSVSAGTPRNAITIHWIGPIGASTAGSIRVAGAREASVTMIRGSRGRALALVRVIRRSRTSLALAIRPRTRSATHIWAYTLDARGQVVSCTRPRLLGRSLVLRVALRRGQTVRLVAVST